MKNLETGNYLLYNTNNWRSPYSLTSDLNSATSVGSNKDGYWYIGSVKNNNGNGNNSYTYYRPSYSNWNSSVSSETSFPKLASLAHSF